MAVTGLLSGASKETKGFFSNTLHLPQTLLAVRCYCKLSTDKPEKSVRTLDIRFWHRLRAQHWLEVFGVLILWGRLQSVGQRRSKKSRSQRSGKQRGGIQIQNCRSLPYKKQFKGTPSLRGTLLRTPKKLC